MADHGPQSLGRVNCPSCGVPTLINQDGRLRHHTGPAGRTCPGARKPAPGGAVRVLKLKDGVVLKVEHAPGTMADEAVTDELVLLDSEWAELAQMAAVDAAKAAREEVAVLADDQRASYLRDGQRYSFAWLIRQGENNR